MFRIFTLSEINVVVSLKYITWIFFKNSLFIDHFLHFYACFEVDYKESLLFLKMTKQAEITQTGCKNQWDSLGLFYGLFFKH